MNQALMLCKEVGTVDAQEEKEREENKALGPSSAWGYIAHRYSHLLSKRDLDTEAVDRCSLSGVAHDEC